MKVKNRNKAEISCFISILCVPQGHHDLYKEGRSKPWRVQAWQQPTCM